MKMMVYSFRDFDEKAYCFVFGFNTCFQPVSA